MQRDFFILQADKPRKTIKFTTQNMVTLDNDDDKKIFRIFNTLIYYVINLNIVYNLLYRSNTSLGRLS